MLEYTKIILQKVSFDSYLFNKELYKAFYQLEREDLNDLYVWSVNSFGDVYPEIIQKVFMNLIG
jgi:hypothetical protein